MYRRGEEAMLTKILTILALTLLLATPVHSQQWSYTEKVLYANFIRLCHEDIGQTIKKVSHQPDKYYEGNPIVRPFTTNPEVFRAAGFIGQGYLTQRWTDMECTNQRTTEMLIGNAIEMAALISSGERAYITVGFEL